MGAYGGIRPGHSWLDRAIQGLLERAGARYIEALFAGIVVAILVLTIIDAGVLVVYFDASFGEYARVVLVALGVELLGSLAWFPISTKIMGPAIAWQRGRRDPGSAPAAWAAAVAGPPRVAVTVASFAVVLGLVPVIYAGNLIDLSLGGIAAIWCGVALLVLGGAVLVYLTLEQALLPLIRDIAAHIPAGAPRRPTISVGTKLLGLMSALTVYTATLAVGFASTSSDPEARLGEDLAVVAVVSVTLPLAVALLLRRSLLVRLEDLLLAFSAVRGGSLDARVPNLAGDEIDDVAAGFNEMVEALRQGSEELQASRARLVTASTEARRKVERDLHDGAQQSLMLVNLKLGLIERQLDEDPGSARELVADSRRDLDRALDELRDLAHGIYPAVLTNDGLPGALAEAVEQAAITTSLNCDGARRYSPEIEAAVYFCCLEALQNAAKHAGDGAKATVRLEQDECELRFEVADDGRGFDTTGGTARSAGLQNMADRIGALGGEVRIDARLGSGTTVAGRVPLDR